MRHLVPAGINYSGSENLLTPYIIRRCSGVTRGGVPGGHGPPPIQHHAPSHLAHPHLTFDCAPFIAIPSSYDTVLLRYHPLAILHCDTVLLPSPPPQMKVCSPQMAVCPPPQMKVWPPPLAPSKIHSVMQLRRCRLIPFKPAPIAQWLSHGHWVRISLPALTQSGVLKAQWIGVRSLHPLLCH